ncbi:MAG: GspE/PulE family protein, partial [Terriglobia bacterium]
MKTSELGHLERILRESGLVSPADLAGCRGAGSGSEMLQRLAEAGFVDEQEAARVLARESNLTVVDLDNYDVNSGAVYLMPRSVAQKYQVIPIDFDDDSLVVATADPTNLNDLDDLRVVTGHSIKPVICTVSALIRALRDFSNVDEVLKDTLSSVSSEVTPDDREEAEVGSDAPVVKLVDFILSESVKRRAGDIHIEPQEDRLRVRYRIDGVLIDAFSFPKKTQAGIVSRLKILARLDIADRRLPQDGRFHVESHGRSVDLRVASLPTIHGEKVVIRLLERDRASVDLEALGFWADDRRKFEEMFRRPHGALLVAGPTGSGKTTTLYSALAVLNSRERNIITVEDPVEYRMPGVNQAQVAPKAGLTFATGLRSILRNDPDTIMIGEIRDCETARIAVEAALTGHLVLSTIHTGDAASAASRLCEMGVEPFLISSALGCVVAQRLPRRLCP